MKCTMTDEEHALYLPGCRCGADPKGLIAKTLAMKKTGVWRGSKKNLMNVKVAK